MSQRNSGYERMPLDKYSTPAWCALALLPHLPPIGGNEVIWECTSRGDSEIANVLRGAGHSVFESDITTGTDFLLSADQRYRAIITNPPYDQAEDFIRHALRLAQDGYDKTWQEMPVPVWSRDD